jgi:TRAP-type mannitol/chloroaromatic compound transport system substrate-binding protein
MKKLVCLCIILLVTVSLILMGCVSSKPATTTSQAAQATQSSSQSTNAQKFTWRMQAMMPQGSPDFLKLAEDPEGFVQMLNKASGGQITITPFGSGAIIPVTEQFDAVSQGTFEISVASSSYWAGKIPACNFAYGLPFLLTGEREVMGFLTRPKGTSPIDILQKEYDKYGVHIGSIGGYSDTAFFSKKPVRALADYKGLKLRSSGLIAEVMKKVGASAVYVPAPEVYTSLQTGVVDAAFWGNPYTASQLNLQEVTDYVLFPPVNGSATIEVIVNQKAYNSLPSNLKVAFDMAAEAYINHHHQWVNYMGDKKLKEMLASKAILEVCTLSGADVATLKQHSLEVFKDAGQKDAASGQMYQLLTDYLALRN